MSRHRSIDMADAMSDIELFHLNPGKTTELQGDAQKLEEALHSLLEAKLAPLLCIRFLAS